MTKIFANIAALQTVKSGEAEIMPLAQWQTDPLFGFLNLGHCDLFGIWHLVLGFS